MKLRKALLDSSMHTTRFLLALSSLTWAFLLLLPGSLFEGRPTYAVMDAIANEEIWGIAFCVHGTIAIYTLINGSRNRVTLCLDGFLGCIVWTAATTACFAAHWPSTGIFVDSLAAYRPPAAMSADIWMSIAAWWHLIKHWAEEEREHYERGFCKPND